MIGLVVGRSASAAAVTAAAAPYYCSLAGKLLRAFYQLLQVRSENDAGNC